MPKGDRPSISLTVYSVLDRRLLSCNEAELREAVAPPMPFRAYVRTRLQNYSDGRRQTLQDTYILDAGLEAGLELPFTCRGGICG